MVRIRGGKIISSHPGKLGYHPYRTSSLDLEDKFAKMSLAPYQYAVMVDNKESETTSPGTSSELHSEHFDCHGTDGSSWVTQGFPPPIPLLVYDTIKEAVDIMERPKGPNEAQELAQLEEAEYGVYVACRLYGSFLPVGWKYQRKNARALIDGYDKIYRKKGHAWII